MNETDIQEFFKHIYKHGLYCDVSLQVTDRRERTVMCFSAHKVVLSARSPVLADKIFSKSRTNSIISIDGSPRAFDILLWYMYSDGVEAEEIDELIESFQAAIAYQVLPFCEVCAMKLLELSSHINSANVCSVLEIATYSKSSVLQNLCLQLISKDPENIFLSDDFQLLCEDAVWNVLKQFDLKLNSQDVLRTVVKWMIRHKVSDRKFLSNIDFTDFCSDDFLIVVEEFPNFFSGKEVHAILSSLMPPDPSKLPEWCKRSKTETSDMTPFFLSSYETMEQVKNSALKLLTRCNGSFSKYALYGWDGFEHDMLFKIVLNSCALKLVMIELAFGTAYAPVDHFSVELCCSMNAARKMQAVKCQLISSLSNYYLLINDDQISLTGENMNLLLKVKTHGLFGGWRNDAPVSDMKYRVASVFDDADIIITGGMIIETARVRPFPDWLLFIDPESGEKKFVISSLFFDTKSNLQKLHLKQSTW